MIANQWLDSLFCNQSTPRTKSYYNLGKILHYIIQHTGLLLIVHVIMGIESSFRCCHLTAISQRNYHASAQNNGQLVLFDQLCSNKAVADATINQSYNI